MSVCMPVCLVGWLLPRRRFECGGNLCTLDEANISDVK